MRIVYYIFLLLLFTTTSCRNDLDNITNVQNTPTGEILGSEASDENETDHEEDTDYIWDSSTIIPIKLNETSISMNGDGAIIDGSTLIITSTGTYSIEGSLSNGQIVVDIETSETESKEIVRLILNGVNITNTSNAPIFIKNSPKTIIVLPDKSENYLTDGSTYLFASSDEDEPNATLFSKDKLTIYGNGELNIDANYNDGITSKDGLIIKSGNINVTALDDGIRGKDYLVVKEGTLNIEAGGDGIKSDNETDYSKGYIKIEAGTINITSATDCIAAKTDVIITYGELTLNAGGGSNYNTSNSKKGIKGLSSVIIDDGTFEISSTDDALHSNGIISINGGNLTISSGDDGIHADNGISINNCEVLITKSTEGIESANIAVDNSHIYIAASDDGFNATYSTVAGGTESNDGSSLTITSGYICVNATGGDAIDSNGNITMNGGTVIAHGPNSQPEVGLDYNGTFKLSGGTLIVSGPSSQMVQSPSTSSAQYSVQINFSSKLSANTILNLQDSEGNNLLTFSPMRSYQSIVFSMANIKLGNTYTLYTGGNSTGENTNGLYTGGSYSGGTKYTSFTVSGIVTKVGNSTNFGH